MSASRRRCRGLRTHPTCRPWTSWSGGTEGQCIRGRNGLYPIAQGRHQSEDDACHCRDDRPNYREPPARSATYGHEAWGRSLAGHAVDSIRGTNTYITDPSDQILFCHFILIRMWHRSTLCDKYSQCYWQISGYMFIWTTLYLQLVYLWAITLRKKWGV